MSFFKPQTLRSIQEFVNRAVENWDKKPMSRYALINPDEPIVLRVPNPDWEEGEDGPCEPDDEGNDTHLCYHVISHGGGGDTDDEGNEIGHDGGMFTGMEIDQTYFLATGKRIAEIKGKSK